MDKQDIIDLLGTLNPEETTNLDLSNKDIEYLPPDIGKFKNLEYLNLSYNSLEKLPEELCELKNLKTLLLLRNELRHLPHNFSNLSALQTLDISYNLIEELPPEIDRLTELQSFDASYCRLRRLPVEFIHLLSLKDVHLEENPFEFPPQKVVKRGLYATMYYLTEERKKRSASKVIMQIYNLPEELQAPFKIFLGFFKSIISDEEGKIFNFDMNFVNPDDNNSHQVPKSIEFQLYDFLNFIKENVETLKSTAPQKEKINIFETQVHELRNQIMTFNQTIEDKVKEMYSIQDKMKHFVRMLEEE